MLSFAFVLLLLICPGVFAQTSDYSLYRIQASRIAATLDNSALAAQVLLTGIDGKAALTPAMVSLLGVPVP